MMETMIFEIKNSTFYIDMISVELTETNHCL